MFNESNNMHPQAKISAAATGKKFNNIKNVVIVKHQYRGGIVVNINFVLYNIVVNLCLDLKQHW